MDGRCVAGLVALALLALWFYSSLVLGALADKAREEALKQLQEKEKEG